MSKRPTVMPTVTECEFWNVVRAEAEAIGIATQNALAAEMELSSSQISRYMRHEVSATYSDMEAAAKAVRRTMTSLMREAEDRAERRLKHSPEGESPRIVTGKESTAVRPKG